MTISYKQIRVFTNLDIFLKYRLDVMRDKHALYTRPTSGLSMCLLFSRAPNLTNIPVIYIILRNLIYSIILNNLFII